MGAFNDAVLTVQRRPSGGKQAVQVIHQQVAVGAGGKAIVAGSLNRPDWKHGLAYAQAAPRCPAGCRRSKLPCRGPAMRDKRVCRLHGAKGGREAEMRFLRHRAQLQGLQSLTS
jgi:hypothetical protein